MVQTLFKFGNANVSTCSCLRCGTYLLSSDINVAADTALCRHCGATYHFSELVHAGSFLTFDSANPPIGAKFELTSEGFTASATTRSAQAWFLVPFMLVWSGGSLGGIYGSQIHKAVFDLTMSLFGIPFILGTVTLGAKALMSACGRVVVTRQGSQGIVFEGVGPFGWMRRFQWADLDAIVEADASYSPGKRQPPCQTIVFHFKRNLRASIKFGSLLSNERRWFLISVLRSQLAQFV